MLPRLVAMLDETSWPARKAAVYALGCACGRRRPSSAPLEEGAWPPCLKARGGGVGRRRESGQAGGPSPTRSRRLIGDLVQEGAAVPPDACDAVAAVLAKAPATGRADRPLRAVLAAVPHRGAGWRARNAVDVSGLRDAFPGDEYGRDLVQLCDDVTQRPSERPRSPGAAEGAPRGPRLLPPKLIERFGRGGGVGGAVA